MIDWIMKTSTSGEKHSIQWTAVMQLDDLDLADDMALLSRTQQQMQKTTSVAVGSAAVGLNKHKGKSTILRYNTTYNNRITLDGEALENVKTFTYGCEGVDRQRKNSIFTTEEHLELKTTVNHHQGQDFQYKCQHSSTVWGGNLENYESHHPENTSVH
ncbi:unnamed protein product [Schistosoma curassoni]|uniref:Uncharacterized protein n=1 Tax=Schistosoma curassoni TaxID=6186 RepID=A0A183K2W4_9TREM|nr:unnamed protein product [Schistosoma curassoni]